MSQADAAGGSVSHEPLNPDAIKATIHHLVEVMARDHGLEDDK